MIGISARQFDLDGSVVIHRNMMSSGSRTRAVSRRSSVRPTLDGGISHYDGGTAPDEPIVVKIPSVPESVADILHHLTDTYALVNVSTKDGVFSAKPIRYEETGGTATIELQPKEKLSA